MKAIAENLKALIEAEKKNVNKLESEKDALWDKAFEVGKTDRAAGEEIFRQGQKVADEYNVSYNKLRCLRHSLMYLRDALHEEYDHFQPEFDIQK